MFLEDHLIAACICIFVLFSQLNLNTWQVNGVATDSVLLSIALSDAYC